MKAAEVRGATDRPLQAPDRAWREAYGVADIVRLPRLAPTLVRARFASPQGRRVLVFPGFGTTDRSTVFIRRALVADGFRATGWGIGKNDGDAVALLARGRAHIRKELEASADKTVDLVGWSLGGYLAREVARDLPAQIGQVVTLAAPVVGGPKYTAARAFYVDRGEDLDEYERAVAEREQQTPLQVPVTALFSRRDGIVDWRLHRFFSPPNAPCRGQSDPLELRHLSRSLWAHHLHPSGRPRVARQPRVAFRITSTPAVHSPSRNSHERTPRFIFVRATSDRRRGGWNIHLRPD